MQWDSFCLLLFSSLVLFLCTHGTQWQKQKWPNVKFARKKAMKRKKIIWLRVVNVSRNSRGLTPTNYHILWLYVERFNTEIDCMGPKLNWLFFCCCCGFFVWFVVLCCTVLMLTHIKSSKKELHITTVPICRRISTMQSYWKRENTLKWQQ